MILSGLNKEQREAVESTEGYVRVLASAGSGKTRALTYRYVYLVNELGISTENIACITFTNKAAGEMKKRIRSMIGDHDTGYICTFHGMGVKVLREEIFRLGWPSKFRILDEEDQESLLKRVYKTLGITKSDITFKDAKRGVSLKKILSLMSSHYSIMLQKDSADPIITQSKKDIEEAIFIEYLKEQKKEFCLDFDDLVCIPMFIFWRNEDVETKWAKRFLYVMVDEFQDVSSTNYALCEALSGYHKNLFVVGDPDQLIYEWRGAKMAFFMDFEKNHPGTKTIFMNTNYRSNEGVIKAANALIAFNKNRIPKEMVSTKPSKLLASYYHGKDGRDEAEFVSNSIELLNEKGVSYSDIAILYRAHYVSREFEQSFLKHKTPYIIHSGVPFYQRKEIKDILAYLRLVEDDNNIDFERAIQNPKRGIGEKRLEYLSTYAEKDGISLYEELKKWAYSTQFEKTGAVEFVSLIEDARQSKKGLSVSDLLNMLLSFSGLEDDLRQTGDDERLDNIASLKASIQELEDNSSEEITLKDYLDEISLYTSGDIVSKKDAINLMTIHAAKGLEFPYVFVVGMNEGIFPSSRVTKEQQMEEERRLAYVAFTRAKEKLFITESEGNKENMTFRYPSRFIFNVSLKNVSSVNELSADLVDHAQSYIRNKEFEEARGKFLFKLDDKVNHKVFGDGVVLSLEPDGMLLIQFDRFQDPRKIQQYSVHLLDGEKDDSVDLSLESDNEEYVSNTKQTFYDNNDFNKKRYEHLKNKVIMQKDYNSREELLAFLLSYVIPSCSVPLMDGLVDEIIRLCDEILVTYCKPEDYAFEARQNHLFIKAYASFVSGKVASCIESMDEMGLFDFAERADTYVPSHLQLADDGENLKESDSILLDDDNPFGKVFLIKECSRPHVMVTNMLILMNQLNMEGGFARFLANGISKVRFASRSPMETNSVILGLADYCLNIINQGSDGTEKPSLGYKWYPYSFSLIRNSEYSIKKVCNENNSISIQESLIDHWTNIDMIQAEINRTANSFGYV